MLRLDPLFDRPDQRPHGLELRRQHDDARPRIDRQPRVLFVRHDREQFRDPGVALRRNDAEFGQVRSEGVDALGALTDQQIAGAVLHQLALLLGRLDLHKTHRRSSNRLADRLGVNGIVLVALDVGLHVLRRHQPHLVAELPSATLRKEAGAISVSGKQRNGCQARTRRMRAPGCDHDPPGLRAAELCRCRHSCASRQHHRTCGLEGATDGRGFRGKRNAMERTSRPKG
jgi:hypothetical protein